MVTRTMPATSRRAPAKKARIKRQSVEKVEKKDALSTVLLPAEPAPVSSLENAVRQGLTDLRDLANQGRYTKVRLKFRGKAFLPDLPLAAVVAAEGLTFYWGGLLRALAVNVAGKSLLQVELVHDAQKKVADGKAALLRGELDVALATFREAVEMDRARAESHLNLGIALKLAGERDEARRAFQAARDLDPHGPVGAEAELNLKR